MTHEITRRGDLYATEATRRDVLEVAGRLREEDVRDASAIMPMNPAGAVVHTAESSDWVIAVRKGQGSLEDPCLAIMGVAPHPDPGTGTPWLLSTAEFFEHPRVIARFSRVFLARMFENYSRLINWVDMRNAVSIRWLAWCGFHIGKPEPFGPHGLPFHRIEMLRRSA